LKQLVRDVVLPGMGLGHSDRKGRDQEGRTDEGVVTEIEGASGEGKGPSDRTTGKESPAEVTCVDCK
jgi:hypothetical protein